MTQGQICIICIKYKQVYCCSERINVMLFCSIKICNFFIFDYNKDSRRQYSPLAFKHRIKTKHLLEILGIYSRGDFIYTTYFRC